MVRPISVVKKVVVVGDRNAGKTALVARFADRPFQEAYAPSMGSQVTKLVVDVFKPAADVQGLAVTLLLWDVLGQREHALLRRQFYRGAEAAIIVADASGGPHQVVEAVRFWTTEFREVVGQGPLLFVLTKTDLAQHLDEARGALRDLSTTEAAPVLVVSSRAGTGTKETLYLVCEAIVREAPF